MSRYDYHANPHIPPGPPCIWFVGIFLASLAMAFWGTFR